MMTTAATANQFKHFRWPKLVVSRFTAARSSRSAAIWGYVFAISSASSIIGYVSLYKTPAAREQLVHTLGNNSGINALLGLPQRIDTVGGFTAWRTLGIAMIIGSIWGLLISTKTFRGEEENGRWEMFLTGQTTARKGVANALIGLLAALGVLFIITSAATFAAGQTHQLHFSLSESCFFGLALAATAAEFMAVGALTSQLAPIRRRASMYAALVFGISFLVRAASDADASLGWLINLSPLGWIEKLHPLTDSSPIWLVPITAFCLIFSLSAVYLAGRRDLGASLLADQDTAEARRRFLHSPLGAAFRLEKNTVIGWTLGAAFVGLLYGYIAKSATQIIKDSSGAGKVVSKLAGQAQLTGAKTFLGILFLLATILIMTETTSMVASIRSEESQGYLDNFLVRQTSRLRWLGGRLCIIYASITLSVIAAAVFGWLAETSQHTGVGFHDMFIAGLNILPAEIFIAGIGILTLGFRPRMTTSVMYGVIAWSFLLEMIGSAINLNHYILDTSVIHHIALAPAVSPNWTTGKVYIAAGIMLMLLGAARFNSRDLQNE